MDINKIKRDKKRERKISISMKIPKEISDWLRKENISITKFFVASARELMKQK